MVHLPHLSIVRRYVEYVDKIPLSFTILTILAKNTYFQLLGQ